jgi:GT2 family glycosyltransferase
MLTIAICTYNRPQLAIKAIESAAAQLPEGGEIVVIDQSTKDAHVLREFCVSGGAAGITRYRHLTQIGLTNARNAALADCKRDFIFYLDDDAVPVEGALALHLEEIRKPGIGGSSGPIYDYGIIPPPNDDAVGRISYAGRHLQNRDGNRYQTVETLFGGNMIFKAAALMEVGGFEVGFQGLATWEETDCSFRLTRRGYTLTYNPRAGVLHYPQATGNALSAKQGHDLEYYRSYVRNGTCTFLRGRPRWQQVPFILRHALMCEKKSTLGLKRPGLGLAAFARGYIEGWNLFRRKGEFPRFECVTM